VRKRTGNLGPAHPHAAHDLEPVEVGKHHVEEDHVGIERLHLAKSGPAGGGHPHIEPEVAKGGVEEEGDVVLVVDDEDPADPIVGRHAEMPMVMSPR